MPVAQLPDSLERFRGQLAIAVADDLARRRRRRLRLGAVAVVLAIVAILVNVLPGGGAERPLPTIEPASAVQRAVAALEQDDRTILHVHMIGRQYENGRPDIRWENEFWAGPDGRRSIERAPDGRVVETGHADGYDSLWDGERVLEARAPAAGSTPAPNESFREQALAELRSGKARVTGHVRRGDRDALRIVSGRGGAATFIVDAHDYTPLEFRTRGTGGGTVLRFAAYERLPINDETRKLVSLTAQHPGAPVVRDAAAYQAALARLFPNG